MLYNDYSSQGQWMGVRIKELMTATKTKITKFSEEIGVERTTLRRIIEGERFAEQDQLVKIAEGFGISVERLKMTDIKNEFSVLKGLLENRTLLQKSLTIASDMLLTALGDSERAEMHRLVGLSLQYMKRLDEAQAHLEKSLSLASNTENKSLIRRAVINLTNNFFEKERFDEACRIFGEYESCFYEDFDALGQMHQTKGLCHFYCKDIVSARTEYQKAIDCYEKTQDNVNAGAVLINLADIEFNENNFEKSKDYLLIAQTKLLEHKSALVVANKELSRTHIALNELDKAESLIDYTIREFEKYNIDKPEIYAKILFMKAGITRSVHYAESAIEIKEIGAELKKSISDFLVQLCIEKGEMEKVSKYYHIFKSCIDVKVKQYSKI